VLSSLLNAPLTSAVDAALVEAPAGRIAVLGDPALCKRLVGRGREAVLVSLAPAQLKRAPEGTLEGQPGALPFRDGELAALIGPRLATSEAWEAVLAEWRRAVRSGGVVVLIDRGEPTEPARRALCGGLAGLTQRTTGRTVVTAGRVVRFA
jgi:hypothetical protein